MKKYKHKMDIRDFTDTEIGAINSYVLDNIPNSKLPQLFVLTEEPVKKIEPLFQYIE